MRDRLIHGYFGVDYDIVWDVVMNKVPALRSQSRRSCKERTVTVSRINMVLTKRGRLAFI